jgi:DNA-binding NarL/FixJ family response regulator
LLLEARVIFVTMHKDPAYVTEPFQVGASGYVLKESAASELITAIQEVAKGRNYPTPLITNETLRAVLMSA